jgi:RNA polymerase sigma factor (sigma-70 family)
MAVTGTQAKPISINCFLTAEISCHVFGSFSDVCGDMMTAQPMETLDSNDATLVAQSLAGDRGAFGQIVARYQSLICSLAYSTTGSLAQSEDLAQETFVAAWKQLSRLREPHKLRSWLCGIVRNLSYTALHEQGREPSHAAEPLDSVDEASTSEPLPSEQAISGKRRRSSGVRLKKIPTAYREALVLLPRHQSIEQVADWLDLNDKAVRQAAFAGTKAVGGASSRIR